MVRHSGNNKNLSNKTNLRMKRRPNDSFKNKRQSSVNKSKVNDKEIHKKYLISKFRNEQDVPESKKYSTSSAKEELLSSDSEPDAFSQLVSCFANSSKKTTILSDEDSDTEIEDCELDVHTADKIVGTSEERESSNETSSDYDTDSDNLPENDKTEDIFEENLSPVGDPFESHVQYELDDSLYDAVSSNPQKTEEFIRNWPILGQIQILLPIPTNSSSKFNSKPVRIDDDVVYAKPGEVPHRIQDVSKRDWEKLSVKSQIQGNILRANCKHVDKTLSEEDELTPVQKELFSIINNYQDLYYPNRTLDNGEDVRFVYCLHTVNHVLKTRLKVIHHNARLTNKDSQMGDIPDEFRDQGLIRPKVLILVPFRNSALRVVEMIASILLEEGNNNILNKKRFYDEFNAGEIAMPRKNPKPEDYEKTFSGDTDDNFKIGISVTKKSLKLYADFYSADIIIASPLGLRLIMGAEGQADRDYDFLASIELLVLDQAEIILMQNWDHLLQVWDHLHLQPRESHGTNFARVRPWALSGHARFYRQTLLFSAYALPQICALFLRKCHNYAGKISVVNPIKTGTICQIILQLPQVFNRIECSSIAASIDARFEYFINKVLPQYKEPMMSHTLIYVPSYFDYVRIRNHFKKKSVSFVQICEYSKDSKIARARDMFFHSSAHFLLYSERFHFFRRIRLKGIRHIIFYQLPTIPHFYSELCNLMQINKQAEEDSLSVSALYTQYDAAQLAAIVNSERAARMLASDRTVHMFMSNS